MQHVAAVDRSARYGRSRTGQKENAASRAMAQGLGTRGGKEEVKKGEKRTMTADRPKAMVRAISWLRCAKF